MRKLLLLLLLFTFYPAAQSQQIPDKEFEYVTEHPAYPVGSGPIVLLDEAHHNFHTADGRYYVFVKILRNDGYRVVSGKQPFSPATLKDVRILVIANALNKINAFFEGDNETKWKLPTPSAFTADEIKTVEGWVRAGGSFFLIADHMPMSGAAEELAKIFGFTFYNGFASETISGLYPGQKKELDSFTKADKTLAEHPVTQDVNSIVTFTGQGFRIPSDAVSLLTFTDKYEILLPDTAWIFGPHTLRIPAAGLSQGAVADYGKGRVAIFGEAAMFSGQLKGSAKIPMGLNSSDAPENARFLLNIIHWLDDIKTKNVDRKK
jgi:hypothetical protein